MQDIITYAKSGLPVNNVGSVTLYGNAGYSQVYETQSQNSLSGLYDNLNERLDEYIYYVVKISGDYYVDGQELSVGGGGGGGDADTLDGQHGDYYRNYANFSGVAGNVSGLAFRAPSGQYTLLNVTTLNTNGITYLGGNTTVNGDLTGNGSVRAGAGNYIYFNGGPFFFAPTTNRLMAHGNGGALLDRLTLGTEVSGAVSIKTRNGGNSGVIFRNGTDTANIPVEGSIISGSIGFTGPSGNFTNTYTTQLIAANATITNGTVTSISYSQAYPSVNSWSVQGNNVTIPWNSNHVQSLPISGNVALTFTAPTGPARLQLIITQDAIGNRVPTWPATVKWPGGVAPTLTTTASGIDIIAFWYNGTNYLGTSALDFR